MKIVILSCDNYEQYWEPFFICLNKYYPNHPDCYLVTETKTCKYCNTININTSIWTDRFREALKQIPDDQVLVMLEDFFIRQLVNEQEIENAINIMKKDNNIAVCNFELQYRDGIKTNYSNYDMQKNNQMYLNSCQPSLWNKEILIKRLSKSQTAWEWEMSVINSVYKHLINNTGKYIIDIGYRHQSLETGWGVTRGKLSQECIDFFKKENIKLNNENKIKLSIITPYYNVLQYTKELAQTLVPQLTDETEWIIIDDGCHEKELDKLKAKVIHLEENSGGASIPRNEGIKIARGDYITFIDADDLVEPIYISKILDKINSSSFDYCMFSWRGIGPILSSDVNITAEAPAWNTSVWNCVYKANNIKYIQFNPELCIAEDYEFNLKARHGIRENIKDILYIYRSGVENSLTRKHEKYNKKQKKKYDYSNIFYFYQINAIGGVETFFYELAKKYNNLDITVFYENADSQQLERLKKLIRVKKYNGQTIRCKKAFFNYHTNIIDNVIADEYYQIMHADYKNYTYVKPPQHPKITHYLGVTQAVCDGFTELTGSPCELCYNPLTITKPERVLHLVSATRLTFEKGGKRIEQLAAALEKENIPYEWTIFSDKKTPIGNHNIVFLKPRLNIYDYLKRADYVVQLSDTESFCYTMVEALSLGTPVIVCPWPCLKELGVNENNAFILPFDMQHIPVQDIYNKEFNFSYAPPTDQWNQFLSPDKSIYKEELKKLYKVKALNTYREKNNTDVELKMVPDPGYTWIVTKQRLDVLLGENPGHDVYVEVIEEINNDNTEEVI